VNTAFYVLAYVALASMIALAYLAIRRMPNDSSDSLLTNPELRSIRRRLTTRFLEAEIRSTSRRLRRELDHELDEFDTHGGHNHA